MINNNDEGNLFRIKALETVSPLIFKGSEHRKKLKKDGSGEYDIYRLNFSPIGKDHIILSCDVFSDYWEQLKLLLLISGDKNSLINISWSTEQRKPIFSLAKKNGVLDD